MLALPAPLFPNPPPPPLERKASPTGRSSRRPMAWQGEWGMDGMGADRPEFA